MKKSFHRKSRDRVVIGVAGTLVNGRTRGELGADALAHGSALIERDKVAVGDIDGRFYACHDQSSYTLKDLCTL